MNGPREATGGRQQKQHAHEQTLEENRQKERGDDNEPHRRGTQSEATSAARRRSSGDPQRRRRPRRSPQERPRSRGRIQPTRAPRQVRRQEQGAATGGCSACAPEWVPAAPEQAPRGPRPGCAWVISRASVRLRAARVNADDGLARGHSGTGSRAGLLHEPGVAHQRPPSSRDPGPRTRGRSDTNTAAPTRENPHQDGPAMSAEQHDPGERTGRANPEGSARQRRRAGMPCPAMP